MASEDFNAILSRLRGSKRLPSPTGVAIRVLELCRREDSESQEIADVIMSDPALSGRLLKYANSPAVGVGREVTSVRDAVLIMGLRAVKLTALGFSLALPESKPTCPGFDFKRFWIESFLTAVIARHLAAEHFNVDREEAFSAGLLARMGSLALAHGLPERYNRALQTAAREGRSLLEVEREQLKLDHVEFGARLLSDWRLPKILLAAVAYQREPDQAPEGAESMARTIHVARRLAPLFVSAGLPHVDPREIATARHIVENTLKMDEASWNRAADAIVSTYREVADIFEMPITHDVSVLGLYEEAQEEATSVGMVAHLEQIRTLEMNRELLQRATTDALTGIANRAKFEEKLEEAVKGLRRGHGDFVVMLLDIDHFKRINDTFGHDVGDFVLKQVARAVENALREVDVVARHGGEEFAILAPRTGPLGAAIMAGRVCKGVQDLRLDVKGKAITVTVSAGVAATADYTGPPTAEQLMRDADQQLYLSKKAGRNTWSYRGRSASAPASTDHGRAGAA
jgi:diguanylate cyclase (GGDEF)-like protein